METLERVSKILGRSTLTCRRYQYLHRWWSVVPVAMLHEGGNLYRIIEANGASLYDAFYKLDEVDRKQLQYQPFSVQKSLKMSVDVRPFIPAPLTQIANYNEKSKLFTPHNMSKLVYKGNASLNMKDINKNLPFKNFVDVGDSEPFNPFEDEDEVESIVLQQHQIQHNQQVNKNQDEQAAKVRQPSSSGLSDQLELTDLNDDDKVDDNYGGFYLQHEPTTMYNESVTTIKDMFKMAGITDISGIDVYTMEVDETGSMSKVIFSDELPIKNPIDPEMYMVDIVIDIIFPYNTSNGSSRKIYFMIDPPCTYESS